MRCGTAARRGAETISAPFLCAVRRTGGAETSPVRRISQIYNAILHNELQGREYFVNFARAVRRMKRGGQVEGVFALSLREDAAAFNGEVKRTGFVPVWCCVADASCIRRIQYLFGRCIVCPAMCSPQPSVGHMKPAPHFPLCNTGCQGAGGI